MNKQLMLSLLLFVTIVFIGPGCEVVTSSVSTLPEDHPLVVALEELNGLKN